MSHDPPFGSGRYRKGLKTNGQRRTFHVARNARQIGQITRKTSRNGLCCHLEIEYEENHKARTRTSEMDGMMSKIVLRVLPNGNRFST